MKEHVELIGAEIEQRYEATKPYHTKIAEIVKKAIIFQGTVPSDAQIVKDAIKAWVFFTHIYSKSVHKSLLHFLLCQIPALKTFRPLPPVLVKKKEVRLEPSDSVQTFQDYFNYFQSDYQETYNTRKATVVFTPIEVVDFMVKSTIEQTMETVKDNPNQPIEFLEPFSGFGIFTARLYFHLIDTPLNVVSIRCKELCVMSAIMCKIYTDQARWLNPKLPFATVYCGDVFDENNDWTTV